MKDDVVGRMRDEMEALLSEESSGEEEEDEDERDDYQNGKNTFNIIILMFLKGL
jgi:hypothetical protein